MILLNFSIKLSLRKYLEHKNLILNHNILLLIIKNNLRFLYMNKNKYIFYLDNHT